MPQVIHVVQCYGCRMYQVDIVKKSPKWTCKLCGEKQSLKTVFFQGSGKECRLQVQRLNELKGSTEQNHFNEDDSSSFDRHSSDDLPSEEIKTQTKWSDFVDEHEDDVFNEVIAGVSIEHTDQEVCYKSDTPKLHQQTFTDISEGNFVSSACNNIVHPTKRFHEKSTDCFGEGHSGLNQFVESHGEPATKLRKIETNNTAHQSEWDQYLPDELSDE